MARVAGATRGSGSWFSKNTPIFGNVDRLYSKLQAYKGRYLPDGRRNYTVRIGYSTHYALYVHENLTASHRVGQAKFLEVTVRRYGPTVARLVADKLRAGYTLKEALMSGGMLIKTESQKITPVDTGILRASAFVRIE